MSDAKNWGLNKRRAEFEGGEGQVWKVQEGGGPTTRPRSKRRVCECRSAALRCVHQCQAHPMRQNEQAATWGGGGGIWGPGCFPLRTEGMCGHGPIKPRLCLAKACGKEREALFFGGKGDLEENGKRKGGLTLRREFSMLPPARNGETGSSKRRLVGENEGKCPGAPPTKPGFEAGRPEASQSERILQRRAEFRL